MLFNLLNVPLYFISKKNIPFSILFIFLLFLPLILSKSILPISSNKETLPMNIQQIIPEKFIKENTDLYLISTKDGYLHALNNEKKQIWKVYLEQELMSSPLSLRKLGKDFYLYPINEQLYIYKDGEFISFNFFIKDLVKRHFLTISDFTLLGKTKTTLFIIDVDTGEIIQKIDEQDNFSFKKRYILSKNKNTITVVRVDYILSCLGLGEEQKFWNASYSDILIQKGNEHLPDGVEVVYPKIEEIIKEYNNNNLDINNDINSDNIITAYSYFDKDLPPIKFYDRSESGQKLDWYNNKKLNGEMKELIEYNNKNKNNYEIIDDDVKNIIIENLNKKNQDILGLPNYVDNGKGVNKEYNNNKQYDKITIKRIKSIIFNHIKSNWYFYIIIIILIGQLIYYKNCHKLSKEKEEKKDKSYSNKNETQKCMDNNNIYNDIINNVYDNSQNLIKTFTYNNKTISFRHRKKLQSKHVKKSSYDIPPEFINNTNIIITKNESNQNKKKIKNQKKTINNIISNEKENKNDINNSNNSSQSIKNEKENTSTNKESKGTWDDENEKDNEEKEQEKSYNLEKSEENESDEEKENEEKNNTQKTQNPEKSEKKTNGIWDDDEDEDENEEEKDNTRMKNTKSSKKSEKNENISNGIWDDEDEDEDDNEDDNKNAIKTKKKNKEKSEIIINDNNDNSYEHKETNENTNPKASEEINDINIKKEKKQSRLDTDFENLEKIGQGGFGIVLKGRHKIDKDIYAIKIIDITYNSKECDEIVSEAKKMNSIKGEYIVNYSICWYDDNLGTAEKFFEKEENTSSLSSSQVLSKSININLTKKQKKNILYKSNEDIFNIEEVNDEENYDENINNLNNTCFGKESKSKNNNKNNSLEIIENNNNKIYNNYSKYCFEYMDDSKLLNNSILSKKYNEEINNKKEKKYFFILMEYCDGLTLEIFINQHSNKTIERKIIYNYIKQILKGLKKLHKNGIIHRDIKPGNIFIKNEQIKIGDFGLATKFKKNSILQTKDLRGITPTYAAPEQLNSKTYNEKIDIYATGITLLEMCGCFGTEMERQLSIKDLKIKRNIPEKIMNDYPQECELIKMMTEKDYNERPSAEQILKSKLFIELGKIINK